MSGKVSQSPLRAPEKVALTPSQELHLRHLKHCIERLNFHIDNSETGSGKTFTTSALAAQLPVESWAVFAPAKMLEYWRTIGRAFCAKPLVVQQHRQGVVVPQTNMLLVIDELQEAQGRDIESIIERARQVLEADGYVLVTSANPFRSLEGFYTLFQGLGLLEGSSKPGQHGLKANYDHYVKSLRERYSYLEEGLSSIELAWLRIGRLDLSDSKILWNASMSEYLTIMYRLATRLYMSCNPRVLKEGLRIVAANLVYRLTDEQRPQFEAALQSYSTAGHTRQLMLKTLHRLEFPFLVDIVLRILGLKPQAKVVVFIDSNDQAALLLELLGTFGIAALKSTGDTRPLDRETGRRLFNQPNLLYRVILLGAHTGGAGISLHDEDGRFPRYLVSYVFDDPERMAQLVGRHIRVGTKSKEVGTYIISTDAMYDDQEEREIVYSKSLACRELIHDTLIGLPPPEQYETVYTAPDSALQAAERVQSLLGDFQIED